MSEHMKRLKEVTAMLDKARKTTDEDEKKELMTEFWNDAFDAAEEMINAPLTSSGFIVAEQIKNHKFTL